MILAITRRVDHFVQKYGDTVSVVRGSRFIDNAGIIDIRVKPSLEVLQDIVNGYIELHTPIMRQILDTAPAMAPLDVFVNEEGLLDQLPSPVMIDSAWPRIFGDVAFCGGTDKKGETLPLSSSQREYLLGVIRAESLN